MRSVAGTNLEQQGHNFNIAAMAGDEQSGLSIAIALVDICSFLGERRSKAVGEQMRGRGLRAEGLRMYFS